MAFLLADVDDNAVSAPPFQVDRVPDYGRLATTGQPSNSERSIVRKEGRTDHAHRPLAGFDRPVLGGPASPVAGRATKPRSNHRYRPPA
jgi:hypothetical protein